ncbi:MAG: hypothetical protein QNJ45_09025 [Ardenticatenaceae bacterium]|nr:hypothetical protein [Ardenticatenaceae bacterium]
MININWSEFDMLDEVYGPSFFILEPDRFAENFLTFRDAFQKIYPNTRLAYSYKTNYTPRLCREVDRLGGWAEVVSGMEYDLALRVGVSPDRIIFNGPLKSRDELSKTLAQGAIVNLDGPYELALLQEIDRSLGSKIGRVGVRCNLELPEETTSRFGFDVTADSFAKVLGSLQALKNIKLAGLHCHVMVPGKDPAHYRHITCTMLALHHRFFTQQPLDFIDLGGGFFSPMPAALSSQFGHPIPTWDEYAVAIAQPFAARFPDGSGPTLILEPGIALTADVMHFVTKVIDIKRIQARKIALVAGSVYDIKPTLHQKNMPVKVCRQIGSTPQILDGETVDIVGFTCMEHDCLYKDLSGPISVGDYLIFEHVGAYTTVLRPPFIQPGGAILALNATGATNIFEVVKRAETGEDVFAPYLF